jgi:hypothetical protein
VQDVGGLDGGLGMEIGRLGYLEEDTIRDARSSPLRGMDRSVRLSRAAATYLPTACLKDQGANPAR